MASAEEVRDALLKLDMLVCGDEFRAMSKAFVSEHSGVFEFTDENKLEYTEIHNKYQEKVEEFLSGNLSDIELEAVMTGLPTMMDASSDIKTDRNISECIDVLHAVTDFEFFKDMMLASKREGCLQEEDLAGSSGATGFGVAEYEFMFEELKSSGDGGGWTLTTDKKWFRVETKQIKTKQYTRFTAMMDLTPEQVIDAFRFDNPDCGKWFPILDRSEILKEYSPADRLARAYTKFDRVMLIPGLPTHLDVRVICRPDYPEKGCACLGSLAWDTQTDTVKANRIFKVRTILARPQPGDPGKSVVVLMEESSKGWMPSWMRNSMLASVGPRLFNHVMVAYKQVKGLP